MGLVLAPFVVMAALVIGFSIYGLFNKKGRLRCKISGVILMIISAPGALHAWGETKSFSATTIYLIMMLVGLICVVRQFIPRKQQKENA